jgi:tetratricopeptide (TPR) repeat protein
MSARLYIIKIITSIILLSPAVTIAQAQVGVKERISNQRLAEQYYKQGEYEKALEYIEPLLKTSFSGAVYDMAFNSYIIIKEFKKAEKLAERSIKKVRGNNGKFYADLVYLNLLTADEKEADKVVNKVLGLINKTPAYAYSFANAFQKRGYPKIALEIYETAELKLPSSNFDYQKALLYGELGDIKTMYSSYVDMVERTPSYLSTVKQLLARSLGEEASTENSDFLKQELIQRIQKGGSKRMNDLLVFVFIQEKNFNGAFTQLKALDRRKETNKSEIFNLGRVALNSQDFRAADKIFKYIIKQGEENPFYEEGLIGRLQTQKGKLETQSETQTEEWADLADQYKETREILIGQPQYGAMSIEFAHILAFQLDDVDSAEAVLRNVLNRGFANPEDKAKAKVELGDVLLYQGNRWDAIIFYGQAEKEFERSPIGQEAKFKRAKAAYFVGDFKWAQGIFDVLKASTSKLIANDAMRYSLLLTDNLALDTNMEAMQLYAQADFMNYQGKRDSALEILEVLKSNYVGHSLQDEVLYLKATILTKKGDYQSAAKNWQELIEVFDKDILADDALYYLALLNESQFKNIEKAKELYQRLFTEHPDSFFATDARKKFRELRGDSVIN